MRKIIFTIFILWSSVPLAQAAFFKDIPRQLIQPNGDTLHCFISGDEFYNYLHDAHDFTIVQDVNTGYFVYAAKSGDEIVATAHIAGKVNPATVNLSPRVKISPREWQLRRSKMMDAVPHTSQAKSTERNRGHINNLVISIRFNGDAELTTPFSTMESMFNDSSTVTTTSMYNYFKSTSYNQLSIVSYFYPQPHNNVVLSYEDPFTRNYYLPYSATNPDGYWDYTDRTEREFALLARAVDYVKDSIPADLNLDYDNDGRVDNICFVVKGEVGDWSDLLWPHRWSLYGEDAYIGDLRVWDFNFQLESSTAYFNVSTLCHEMFHTLGAPDLYRYYDYTEVHPVGTWDLMEYNTNPPQHSGAYMKLKYGNWIDSIPEITTSGTYSLRPVGSATPENICYKIASADPDQFYVLEYRKNSLNFETALPGSGLLIYRIDTRFHGNASFNNIDVFDEVYLFRPNGDALTNGNYGSAHFGTHVSRDRFNNTTNPSPFLTQGIIDLLDISDIIMMDDSLIFTYNNNPQLIVSRDHVTLGSTTGSFVDFNIASNASWQISGGRQGWMRWSPSSGNGSTRIQVEATSSNFSSVPRLDTLIISSPGLPDKIVRVYQNDFLFLVSDTLLHFPLEGGTADLEITSDEFWRIFDLPTWLSVTPNYGLSTTNATVEARAYSEGGSRTTRFQVYTANASIYITAIQSALGISTNDISTLSVYPNPMQNTLHIEQRNGVSNIRQVEISDITGKRLVTKNANDTSISIPVEQLPQGIYILQLYFENGTKESVKVVK